MTDLRDEASGLGEVTLPQADGDGGQMVCLDCGYIAVERGNGLTADYWNHMAVAHGYGPGGPALDGER